MRGSSLGFETVSTLLMATMRGRWSCRKWGRSTWSPEVRGPGLRQPDHHVGLVQGGEGRLHQGLVQGPLGVQDPGGVQEEQLRLRQVDDAQQAKAAWSGAWGK